MVLEINYSPGFRESEKGAGMDIPQSFLTYAANLVRGKWYEDRLSHGSFGIH